MNVFLAVGQQLFFGDGCTGDHLDKGARHLACMGVRLADGTGKSHSFMAKQRFFDLGRINVVTATDDQILRTACNPDIAVRILAA